jgi:hypothetical protein
MGLYDHTGQLFINGHPSTCFTPAQLHTRTTVCFQDHSKYSLTLRENVGIGCVPLMHSDPAVHAAITKGGAEGVLAKVGMEGKLDRHGVPDAAGQDEAGNGGSGGHLEDGLMQPPPPPPGGRGGGRGGGPPGRGGGRGGGLLGSPGGPLGPPPGAPSSKEMMMMMEDLQPGRQRSGPQERQPLSGGQWQRECVPALQCAAVTCADSESSPPRRRCPRSSLHPRRRGRLGSL